MKRTLPVLAALLAVGAYAGAAVVDGFEDPWTYNYTEIALAASGSAPVTSEASGTTPTGLAAVSGSKLGVGTTGGTQRSRTRAHLADWAGAPLSQLDQAASLYVAVVGLSADGGGLVIKTIDYGDGLVGGYVVGIADTFDVDGPDSIRLQILAHDLKTNGSGGMAFTEAGRLPTGDHTNGIDMTIGDYLAGQWLKLTATITAVDATNVVDVVVTDLGGSPVGPGTGGTPGEYQYVDAGAEAVNARAPGAAGLFVWGWNNGPDFDDLFLDAVSPPCILGDANGDGQVGVADLSALADNYGATGATWAMGEFTGDGIVGVADLSALADSYGNTGDPCTPPTVPEPATLCLLGLGGAVALLRKRR